MLLKRGIPPFLPPPAFLGNPAGASHALPSHRSSPSHLTPPATSGGCMAATPCRFPPRILPLISSFQHFSFYPHELHSRIFPPLEPRVPSALPSLRRAGGGVAGTGCLDRCRGGGLCWVRLRGGDGECAGLGRGSAGGRLRGDGLCGGGAGAGRRVAALVSAAENHGHPPPPSPHGGGRDPWLSWALYLFPFQPSSVQPSR